MKHAIAILLLCLPAQLSAGERCTATHANRSEATRPLIAKPTVNRAAIARPLKVRLPIAWQRIYLYEQQIL